MNGLDSSDKNQNMLVQLKAKVLLENEDQMELEGTYDLGNIAKGKKWAWRMIAVPSDQIYKIVQFNKSKTIVYMNDDEKILSSDSFEKVYARWLAAKLLEGNSYEADSEEEEETKENEEDE